MAAVSGLRLSAPQLLRLLHGQEFVWRRTKRTLRNLQDPTAIARAHRQLKRLKRRALRPAVGTSSGTATG
jgi:hypothetical protein